MNNFSGGKELNLENQPRVPTHLGAQQTKTF